MNKERCKYFFDASAALAQAKKALQISTNNQNVSALQVCYYNGDTLDNAPENCINVPIDNFFNYFLMTKNRLPEQIDFTNMDFSDDVKAQLIEALTNTLKEVHTERSNMLEMMANEIKSYQPDFSRPHRIFLMASRETTVMQYATKNVASAFKELGYEVFLSIEENAMQEIAPFIHLANFLTFKPTITFNINHLNNQHLPPELFNIVWFQDSMPIVLNTQNIILRQRDYLYALIPGIKNALAEKGINSEVQSFFIDHHIYKSYPKIKREKKVVFVGSSYLAQVPENTPIELIHELTEHYRTSGKFTNEYLAQLATKYHLDFSAIFQGLLPYIIRDITLIELSKMNLQYELEVYGWGWEKYDTLKPFYKGALSHGEAIAKVYSSAQYALVTHPNYIIQQRTLEATSCGTTALVYDCRYRPEVTEPYYEDELLFFTNLQQLHHVLNNPYQALQASSLLASHSSTKFAKAIITRVNNALNS